MSPWTPEREDTLKLKWAAGVSAGVIATDFGFTRGSVIGKVQRMRLPDRETTTRKPGIRRFRERACCGFCAMEAV